MRLKLFAMLLLLVGCSGSGSDGHIGPGSPSTSPETPGGEKEDVPPSVQAVADSDGGTTSADAAPKPTAKAPSDLLDLTPWKLTLPIPASDPDKPREVTELKGFSIDPHFRLNESADGVLFRAHAGGTTTSNSGYPRSELREMTASGEKAAWSTTSGKHSLELRQAIVALPTVKPHVVAGQIHDAEDDVIMIRLEGKRLFVEGGGDDLGLLDDAYELGKVFVVKIEAEDGTIKVSYDGTPKVTYEKSVKGCYFKAGVYTQSNPSKGEKPDAFGEVVIHAMKLNHS